MADFYRMASRQGEFDSEVFDEALVTINDDFPPAGELPGPIFKAIANKNSTIQVQKKFKSPYNRRNTATIFFSSNGNPKCRDGYIANRLIGIPFNNHFEGTDEEDDFIDLIRSDEMAPVIFSFAIEALGIFFRDGLDTILPESVKNRTAEIIGSLNDIMDWLNSSISDGSVLTNDSLRVQKADLYKLYQEDRGSRALGRNTFYSEIGQRYKEHASNGIRYFIGLGMNSNHSGGELP